MAANAATNRHDFVVDLERAEKHAAADKREREAQLEPSEEEPQLGVPLRVVDPVAASIG